MKCLSNSQVSACTAIETANFVSSLEKSIEHYQLEASSCINYDETRIIFGEKKSLHLKQKDKGRPEKLGPQDKVIGFLLVFVSAAGEIIMSILILKAENIQDDGLATCQFVFPQNLNTDHFLCGKHEHFYAVTQSGYNNTELHKKIMVKFMEWWKLLYPGYHCYVFGDQLSCHYNHDVVICLEDLVFVWSLPANTSHLLQPLDDLLFA